jgi:hypothetical protein
MVEVDEVRAKYERRGAQVTDGAEDSGSPITRIM